MASPEELRERQGFFRLGLQMGFEDGLDAAAEEIVSYEVVALAAKAFKDAGHLLDSWEPVHSALAAVSDYLLICDIRDFPE